MDLSIAKVDEPDGRLLLVLTGSVDLTTKDALLRAGEDAFSGPTPTGLILEMSDVGFLDSSGLGALVTIAGDAQDAGADFSLRNPSHRVTRVLDMTGLGSSWPIEVIS